MKKIAFLVENDFIHKHFGVRNFFMTIKSVLNETCTTDFIMHRIERDTVLWYKLIIEELKNGTDEKYMEYDVNKEANKWNANNIDKFINNKVKNISYKIYFRNIGETLEKEKYDIVFITNPWLINYNLEIKAKHTVGLVYDLIPCQYAFTKDTYEFTLSNNHRKGFEYYNKNCDKIFCDSKECSDEYNKYYSNIEKERISYFKPFVPYEYKSFSYDTKIAKENAIILAAPFDERKGIKIMPKIINGIKDNLETLYIFGMPRCPNEITNKFFKDLKVRHIIYYPFISYSKLMSLYNKSKVLLFPSTEEGLGIPILEAQYCGCRVLTTNKAPMNGLIIEGSELLNDNEEQNMTLLRRMFEENDFNYEGLSHKAQLKYSYNDIKDKISSLLKK